MLPTKEEKSRIQEAQAANPDLPLGSAEQFLLTLTSISELPARLKLWAFKLDFENSEKVSDDLLLYITLSPIVVVIAISNSRYAHTRLFTTCMIAVCLIFDTTRMYYIHRMPVMRDDNYISFFLLFPLLHLFLC